MLQDSCVDHSRCSLSPGLQGTTDHPWAALRALPIFLKAPYPAKRKSYYLGPSSQQCRTHALYFICFQETSSLETSAMEVRPSANSVEQLLLVFQNVLTS